MGSSVWFFLWVLLLTTATTGVDATTATTASRSTTTSSCSTASPSQRAFSARTTSWSRKRRRKSAQHVAEFLIARGGAANTATTTDNSTPEVARTSTTTTNQKRTKKTKKKQHAASPTSTKKDAPPKRTSTPATTTTSSSSSRSNGIVVLKVRQILRSLLDSTHSTGAVHQFIYTVASWLETLWGTSLLPPKPQSSSTLSSSSKMKKKTTKQKNKSTPTTKTPKSKPTTTTSTSNSNNISNKKQSANYRIQRELQAFLQDPPDHLSVQVGKNIRIWIVTMQGLGIYQGETFRLRIQFPPNYPLRPPSVYFIPPHIPIHEHVYTNGDICLSLLGKDWRPTMTAQSIAHSILSILASATRKTKPMDNARHAHNKPGEYQEAWVYHDDSC